MNARIKRHYSVIAHSPDIVELRHGVWNPTSFTLTDESKSGRLFTMLSRLDGSLSPAQIARLENVPQAEVDALVDHLLQLGAAETAPSTALDYLLESVIPERDVRRVKPMPVLLLGDAELTSEIRRLLVANLPDLEVTLAAEDDPAYQTLASDDMSWVDNGLDYYSRVGVFERWKDHFVIMSSKVVNPVRLRILNRASLEHQFSWVQATVDGPFIFIGPVFVPPASACFECFEARVMINLREAASYQQYKRAITEHLVKLGQGPAEPLLAGLLASHAALEATTFLLTGSSCCINRVLAMYLPTMEFTFADVLRMPGCPACSPLPEQDQKELYFDLRALINA